MTLRATPVVLVTGPKDSGKTTLVTELIRHLGRAGLIVLALKRATEVAGVDEPGTDTARFAAAGAAVIGLTWPGGTYVAAVLPKPTAPEAVIEPGERPPARVRRLARPSALEELVDLALETAPLGERPGLVIAEGFSDTPYPRLHVLPCAGGAWRAAGGPVLSTWRLTARAPSGGPPTGSPSPGTAGLARLIEARLPLLAGWAGAVGSGRRSVPIRQDGPAVVAAVLTGGQGRRLGGADKWRLEVGGLPQSRRCLGVLEEVFDRVLVVGRGPAGGDRAEALADIVPGAGPLGGILTALTAAGSRAVFVFAGDMPFLSRAFIRHMLFQAWLSQGDFDVLLPRWGSYVEPLHALYAPPVLGHLQGLIARWGGPAGRRITELYDGLRVREVPESDIRLFGDPEILFLNLNTPGDLTRARAVARVAPPGATSR